MNYKWSFICAIIFIIYLKNIKTDESITYKKGVSQETNEDSSSKRTKRSVVHLFQMIKCTTSCNPIDYKGYGCYCGFSGSGYPVDGIDRCCQAHDRCYGRTNCAKFQHYFVIYKWDCNHGNPICYHKYHKRRFGNCGQQVCECDRIFSYCLRQYRCPHHIPVCRVDPWRFVQNMVAKGLILP